MATCLFRSPLAFRLQTFLETRRAAGRADTGSQKILQYLDRFLMSELKPGEPITPEIVERWLKSMEHLNAGTRINRISILRQFCLYLSHFDPRTCIIHRSILPRRTRPAPYIYTRSEVCQIMAASRRLGSMRGLVVATVVGLLYATGLRIGEALKLEIRDLDLKRRLIHVRESKFKKSRYVTLSPSTADQLRAYLHRLREAGYPTCPTASLFAAPGGGRYGKETFAR
jgi:integrase/recombinase XerD